jgi:hypothetical protein
MNFKVNTIALAVGTLLSCSAAFAQSGPEFKFSGYGTVGVASTSEKDVDFVGDLFMPKGAGHTRGTSFDPDTRLGLQMTAKFNDQWSAVVQGVSKLQYDGSYTPQIEWANIKYKITPDLSVRLGRIALPNYTQSESRFVGYASTWLRPPEEVYGVLALTSNDGVDLTYRHAIGSANNTIQAYYGTSTSKLPTGDVKSKPGWGVTDTVEIGSLMLRAGYTNVKLDATIPSLGALFAGLNQFAAGASAVPVPAFQAAGAQALALIDKYKVKDMNLSAVSLGATYDPGDWFVASEVVEFKGDGFLSNSSSWYVTGGYRFGSFTPYAIFASTRAKIDNEAGIDTTGAAPLATGAAGLTAGINATLRAFTATQHSAAVGMRWDFYNNMAFKFQVDRIKVGEGSNGRLRTFAPLPVPRSLTVVSAAVDFVF